MDILKLNQSFYNDIITYVDFGHKVHFINKCFIVDNKIPTMLGFSYNTYSRFVTMNKLDIYTIYDDEK